MSIIFVVFLAMCFGDAQSLNITKLMEFQLTLCGPKRFCNLTKFNFPFVDKVVIQDVYRCPRCHCDDWCRMRHNCCPDKYFEVRDFTCVNVTSVNATDDIARNQRTSFLMVKFCPDSADAHLKEKCETDHSAVDKLKYPPVTGQITGLAYANQFCSMCHDEHSIKTWGLDFSCEIFLDINFLSSFEEFIIKGRENKCLIQTVFPRLDCELLDPRPVCLLGNVMKQHPLNCVQMEVLPYRFCNTTGFWQDWDYDVEEACHSNYVEKDKLFKNTFCRVCNPPLNTLPVIGSCNTTGMWDLYDANIMSSCFHYGENPATFPYKNVFCYACNSLSNRRMNSGIFVDTNAVVEKTEVTAGMVFLHNLTINTYNDKYFHLIQSKVTTKTLEIQMETLEEKYYKGRTFPNTTHLIYTSAAIQSYSSFCNGSMPEIDNFNQACRCDLGCLLTNECCEEFSLEYPSMCLNEQIPSWKTLRTNHSPGFQGYKVAYNCFVNNEYADDFGESCRNPGDDVFSLHPLTDMRTGLSFLNLYCYLCNLKNTSVVDISDKLKPWDLKIRCGSYINIHNYLLLSDLLKTMRSADCNITYLPNTKGRSTVLPYACKVESGEYGTCNKTGFWETLDSEIKWGCENLTYGSLPTWRPRYASNRTLINNSYKNLFCAVCNPASTSSLTINECNVTGNMVSYNASDEKGCETFPQIGFYAPYKNVFCFRCNEAPVEIDPTLQTTAKPKEEEYDELFPIVQWYPVFRNLFSFSDFEEDYLSVHEDSRCSDREVYDPIHKKCRDMKCFPGKTPVNGSCLPLLRESTNLSYALSAEFTLEKSETNCSRVAKIVLRFLQRECFKDLIYSVINGTKLYALALAVYLQPCKNTSTLLGDISGVFAVNVFANQSVRRFELESYLYQLMINDCILQSGNKFRMISEVNSEMPIPNVTLNSHCASIKATEDTNLMHNRGKYKPIPVSKILFCNQIVMDQKEFRTLANNLDIRSLPFHYRQDDQIYRICVADILPLFNTGGIAQGPRILLWSITLGVNVMSIVSLLLTISIYIKVKTLQTLAGKNNMILFVSLTITLSIHQLSQVGTFSDLACAVFGVSLHYFWLLSFFCMTICSYHMNKVFHQNNLVTMRQKSAIFLKYLSVVIIGPAIIVSANIIGTFAFQMDGTLGYGQIRCFIDNRHSLLASFVVPVAFLCSANTIFFIRTLISIKKTPDVPENTKKRNEFAIFVRLFTVTGLTWILQIVDAFLQFSAFSFAAEVINGLQGVAIFMAFITNNRVIHLLKREFQERAIPDRLYAVKK